MFVYKDFTKQPFSKIFQIRWREPLGKPECPYLYRWTFIFWGFSIRLHHWIYSDDNRFFHDHSCNFISIILKGHYYNVTPIDNDNPDINNSVKTKVNAGDVWISNAIKKHYLLIPPGGAWTLLLQGKQYHKWGFYVNNHKWRPLRYFKKYGIIQDEVYKRKQINV